MPPKKHNAVRQPAPKRRFRITPSKVFIAILLLFAAIIGVASALGGGGGAGSVDCPAGQVWSSAHGHCH